MPTWVSWPARDNRTAGTQKRPQPDLQHFSPASQLASDTQLKMHRPKKTCGHSPSRPPSMSPRQMRPQPVLQHLCPWGQEESPSHRFSHGLGSAGHSANSCFPAVTQDARDPRTRSAFMRKKQLDMMRRLTAQFRPDVYTDWKSFPA